MLEAKNMQNSPSTVACILCDIPAQAWITYCDPWMKREFTDDSAVLQPGGWLNSNKCKSCTDAPVLLSCLLR